MLRWTDRLFLGAAAFVIGGAGVLGILAAARGPIEPDRIPVGRPVSASPPPMISIPDSWQRPPEGGVAPAKPSAFFYTPRIVHRAVSIPPVVFEILPVAHVTSAKADADGILITWETARREVVLEEHERPKAGPVLWFIVERARDAEEFVPIALLEPEVRTFVDGEAAPKVACRYRVAVHGYATARREGKYVRERSTVEPGGVMAARIPSPHRVKLIGGDAQVAILRAESYDLRTQTWQSGEHAVRPGATIGKTGWTLRALRFDKFTLVADVIDDEPAPRTLTTKE